MAPRFLGICRNTPEPVHPLHRPGEVCSYYSDDPEVRRPDEEVVAKLRKAWQWHGFSHVDSGVYALALG